MKRRLEEIVTPLEVMEGAGVRIRRSIGIPGLNVLDPFLLLDEFKSDNKDDYLAGFPDHPHRGFETVTYMLAGCMEHRDSKGNHGILNDGSVQWMTAGRGIIHSEMPKQKDGLMWGFQLWVNLPAKDKMTAPRYQDIDPEKIPEVREKDRLVRVIAGEHAAVGGAVQGIATRPLYLDVHLSKGGTFHQELPGEHTAFLYIYEGTVTLDGTDLASGRLARLSGGAEVDVSSAEGGRFLLVAARPLNEPVARGGPFVMNTRAEIEQAFDDYRAGRLAD